MRLIDADALKENIEECMTAWDEHTDYGIGRLRSYEWAIELIDNAPTVEQPTGKWCVISLLDDYVYLKCSECGQSTMLVRDSKNEFCCIKDVRDKIVVCPFCGAKMKGGEEE